MRSREPPTGVTTVRAAGRAVSVYEYGEPSGEPVFALHGTPDCGASFAWIDEPARACGLRVLAPDRAGIGYSDRDRAASVADYAGDLGALADALGIDRFTVIGYSGGGPYALAAAAGLARRVRTAEIVAGAGEIGAWATLDELSRTDRQFTWLALHAPAVARAGLRTVDLGGRVAPRLTFSWATGDMPANDRQVLRDLGTPAQALALFTQAITPSAAGVADDFARQARPWGVPLGEISVPVRCWHGATDTLVPLAHAEALVERLPDASLTVWPGEGHMAFITNVADVLDAIVATSR